LLTTGLPATGLLGIAGDAAPAAGVATGAAGAVAGWFGVAFVVDEKPGVGLAAFVVCEVLAAGVVF
jgi:hypothetical protein